VRPGKSSCMTTVFYIAYEFPPLNNGGVLRSAKFTKYLPDFGIRPIVFTLNPSDYSNVFKEYLTDEKLIKELPKEIEIINVSTNGVKTHSSLSKFFSIVRRDTSHWQPSLKEEIKKAIKTYQPKAIIVSAPPFSLITFTRKLAKKLKLPYIVDMRDAWSLWNLSPYRTWFHYCFTKTEEKKCLKGARAIIATSQQTINDFQLQHPSISKSSYNLITNGYDEDIKDWELDSRNNKKFRIGYVGSFYYSPEARKQMFASWKKKKPHQWLNYVPRKEDWLYRSPYFFFKAVSKLITDNQHLKEKIEICFAGHKPNWFDSMVKEHSLCKIVKHIGTLTLTDSVIFQKSCDALLLTSAKIIGGEDYSIAGKTFEYFAARKPIIAFVTNGAQKNLLIDSGLALICNPDDTNESTVLLQKLLTNKIKFYPNIDFLKSLHRKELSKKLSFVIKEITNE
jgi:hypothetical protein